MIYEKVLKFLTEKNINTLSKIGEDESGNLLFGGEPIASSDSMQKSVYDKDDDGIVDLAKSIKDLTSTVEFLNSLPDEIVDIKKLIGNLDQSQIEVIETTAQLPATSKNDTLYVVINDSTVNGICLYLGKDTKYINLFEHIGSGGGSKWNEIVDKPEKVVVNVEKTLSGITVTYDNSTTSTIDINSGSNAGCILESNQW